MISRTGSKATSKLGRAVPHYLIVLAVWLVVGFIGAGELFADTLNAKVIRWDNSIEDGTSYALAPTRGETMVLQPRFLQYGAPMDLTHAYTVYMLYKPVGQTNVYAISGSILNATNGQAQIEWSSSNELAATTYAYDILISDATRTVVGARGAIKFRDGVATGATLTDLQPINILDFDQVVLLNVGNAPFLSSYEIADIRNYLEAIQAGIGDVDARDVTIRGTLNYTNWPGYLARTSDIPAHVSVVAGANITVVTTTNSGRIIYTVTGAAGGGSGGGGIGSYTNTAINGVANTNSIQIGNGINTAWRQDSNGIWRLDMGILQSIAGSNSVQIVVDGQILWDISTNRTMTYVPFMMFTDDYVGNMQYFAGSRLAPSFTFFGHPTGYGIYERGYNGTYCRGWSVGGVEIGLEHLGGITMIHSNAAFYGKLVGNISLATGYPEPLLVAWLTNPQLAEMTITNSGMFLGKDAGGTTRYSLNAGTGEMQQNGQNLDVRYALAPTNMTGFSLTNVFPYGVTNVYCFSQQGVATNHP